MTKLFVTAIENDEDDSYSFIHDIEQQGVRKLLLGFGNGIWDEMRVIGDSEDALNVMRNILGSGGYHPSEYPFPNNHLYQQGDECWQGFVFINPQPHPQDFQ